MLLHLIRHAEASADHGGDPSLSERGVRQAELLPDALRDSAPVRILHSSSHRARQTADIVSRGLGAVPVEECSWARDLTPFPSDDSESYPSHALTWLSTTPPAERDPGSEQLKDALQGLLDLSAAQPLAVVTHAYVVAWFTAHLLGASPSAWLRLPVDNASITTVARNRFGEVVLHRFNWTCRPGFPASVPGPP